MIADSELARTFEKKITKKLEQIATDLWKMDAFGKEYHSWMLAEFKSGFYQVLNVIQWWCV